MSDGKASTPERKVTNSFSTRPFFLPDAATDGAAALDESGWSVSGAGDVNGDGSDDVIIGAPFAGNNTRSSSGSSYVVFGSATPSNVDLASLTR